MTSSLRGKLMVSSLVLMGAGVYLFWLGGMAYLDSAEVSDWVATEGVILDSQYEMISAGSGRSLTTSYIIWVAYRYHVEGQEFIGHRLSTGIRFFPNDSRGPHSRVRFLFSAVDLVERYSEGRELKVYYDPARPSCSLLDTDMTYEDSLALGCGPVLFALGLIFLLKLKRTPGKEEKERVIMPEDLAEVPRVTSDDGHEAKVARSPGRQGALNCKNCGAPLQPSPGQPYFECDHCSTVELPRITDEGLQVLGQRMDVSCPVCDLLLISGLLEDEEVYHCEQCRGHLIPNGRFERIVSAKRARYRGERLPARPLDRRALSREIDCPLCRKPMIAHPYLGPGSVAVDICQSCGLIWLDHGELSVIEKS